MEWVEGSEWVYRLNKIGYVLIITDTGLMDSFYSFYFCIFEKNHNKIFFVIKF